MLMLKILLFAFCIALVNCGIVVQSGPQYGPQYGPHYTKEKSLHFGPLALQATVGLASEPYDPAPKYSYGYNVRDSYAGLAGVSVVPGFSAVLKPASGPYPGGHYAAYPGGHSSGPYYRN